MDDSKASQHKNESCSYHERVMSREIERNNKLSLLEGRAYKKLFVLISQHRQ